MFQISLRSNFKNPVKKTPVHYILAGVEEDISQEPDIADPKCGISIMNIPPNRIHLVGVPYLKSLILHYLPLPLGKKSKSI